MREIANTITIERRTHGYWWYENYRKRHRTFPGHAAWEQKLNEWKAGVAGWLTPSDQRG